MAKRRQKHRTFVIVMGLGISLFWFVMGVLTMRYGLSGKVPCRGWMCGMNEVFFRDLSLEAYSAVWASVCFATALAFFVIVVTRGLGSSSTAKRSRRRRRKT
ncbi:MAG: hypothetical protein ABW278_01435 [Steroidobacteraceae bacterium]